MVFCYGRAELFYFFQWTLPIAAPTHKGEEGGTSFGDNK